MNIFKKFIYKLVQFFLIKQDTEIPDKLPKETDREALYRNMAEGHLSRTEKELINNVCDKADAYDKLVQKHPKEDYYNSKYPKRNGIVYNGRYIPSHGKYSVDIRDFFTNPNSEKIQSIVKDWKSEMDDDKAMLCQAWVKRNIKYISDKKARGLTEYWQYPQETLFLRTGDCDDGAILMGNLMIASGIPYWKIRLNAGGVYNPQGDYLGGHAWLNYYYEKGDKWVIMDWCFYPKFTPLEDRPNYKDEKMYGKGEVWFSWNKKYSFSKSATEIKQMKNIK